MPAHLVEQPLDTSLWSRVAQAQHRGREAGGDGGPRRAGQLRPRGVGAPVAVAAHRRRRLHLLRQRTRDDLRCRPETFKLRARLVQNSSFMFVLN